eukprot:145017-Hanusia_phi.AAC.1
MSQSQSSQVPLATVLSRPPRAEASLRRPDPHPARPITLGTTSRSIQSAMRDSNARKQAAETLTEEDRARREAEYQRRLAQWHRSHTHEDGMHIDEYEKWCKTSGGFGLTSAKVTTRNSISTGKGQPVVKSQRGSGIQTRRG